jgi:hypothetical protein
VKEKINAVRIERLRAVCCNGSMEACYTGSANKDESSKYRQSGNPILIGLEQSKAMPAAIPVLAAMIMPGGRTSGTAWVLHKVIRGIHSRFA